MIKIAPSILSADFANLQGDLNKVPNADMLHVDVMDGHFVPNITVGLPVIQSLKKSTSLPLDVHLMVDRPQYLIEAFCALNPASLTVHVEADHQQGIETCLKAMKHHGILRCLAIRPNTKPTALLPFLSDLDMILVMTVEPGFGGQSFLEGQLETIAAIKEMQKEYQHHCPIQVDGGINEKTAPLVKAVGAEVLVAGSAVFGAENPEKAVELLREVK